MAKQEAKTAAAAGESAKSGAEVKAFARYIHMSPRKLRLVADLIRRSRVDAALEQLKFSSKDAALPMAKLLNSAIANAVHNFDMKKEDLVIKSLTVDGGPVMKRLVPRAQGRAELIRRRMSHINLVLASKPRTAASKSGRNVFSKLAAAKPETAEAKPAKAEVEAGQADVKNDAPKAAPKTQEKLKKQTSALKRRLFNRKSGE